MGVQHRSYARSGSYRRVAVESINRRGEKAVKVAVVFPGQGSQYVGMGREACETYPEVAEFFRRAEEVLGFPLAEVCFDGPSEALTDTANAQPAIFTVSLALWEALKRRWPDAESSIAYFAGHSLGEYTALAAAGAFDFEDGLRLVRERGRLMKEAGARNPGGMVAVIGLDPQAVDEVCGEIRESHAGCCLRVANYNSPGQYVLAGHREALERAIPLLRAKGARRMVPLAVSGAFHTELMCWAREGLAQALDSVEVRPARVPVIANTTARPISEPEEIRQELLNQLENPVRWTDSVRYMVSQGVDTFVEVGPKKVLTGLIKRIARDVRLVNVEGPAELEHFAKKL